MSNISPAATQDDLQQLFEKFGRIQRIHLGRDRRTNESRGFAFINYQSREDGQKAIDVMNGHGYDIFTSFFIFWPIFNQKKKSRIQLKSTVPSYDHLILSVEWSENRKKENTDGDSKPSGYQSRVRRN